MAQALLLRFNGCLTGFDCANSPIGGLGQTLGTPCCDAFFGGRIPFGHSRASASYTSMRVACTRWHCPRSCTPHEGWRLARTVPCMRGAPLCRWHILRALHRAAKAQAATQTTTGTARSEAPASMFGGRFFSFYRCPGCRAWWLPVRNCPWCALAPWQREVPVLVRRDASREGGTP